MNFTKLKITNEILVFKTHQFQDPKPKEIDQPEDPIIKGDPQGM